MKIMLFRPFDIGAWFTLGFSAFLISLAESSGSGGGNFFKNLSDDSDYGEMGDMVRSFGDTAHDFLDTGLGIGLAILAGFTILIVGLLLLWLSSRGRFMFLDNLVHQRTKVSRPWSEFASQGDSLFLWQIVYTVILVAVLGLFALIGLTLFGPLMIADAGWMVVAPMAALAGTIIFIIVIAMIYIDFFLTTFVVPIMHRERVGTMAAWARFLTVFREHPGSFFLFGLVYMALTVAGTLAFALAGLLTCCIGIVLMAIPYVGSVITLPMSVFLRYFTLDFLGQFGDEFRLLDPVNEGPNELPEFDNNRTVIGTEDLGQNGSTDKPGPEGSGD